MKAERRHWFNGECCRGEHHPVTSDEEVRKKFRSASEAGRERVLEVILFNRERGLSDLLNKVSNLYA